MKRSTGIGIADVQAVYGGPEGRLWELVMGQQVHIGGFRASMELADRAAIRPGATGVDLCCCTGAGMRFLVRFRSVAHMQGVDCTPAVIEVGIGRCAAEGLGDKISFTQADARETGLAAASFDFVWGEDAWCYVDEKDRLIAEVVRLVKPGGVVAFTDWIEGPSGLTEDEAGRFLRFMKFPSIETLSGYSRLLSDRGCEVELAQDTGQFARHVDLYIDMLDLQLTSDALRLVGFDAVVMERLAGEMTFMQRLAHDGKIAQGRFVARRRA
ncbi:MAG: methyltransferase domain-containing protein [Candidatus Riflebacteria bacterium]|nr:methyltransferase domain-containing protein [Candidatus Riflebacteria bacterium]